MPDNEVLSAASRKRKVTSGEDARRVCRACEGYHPTRYCFNNNNNTDEAPDRQTALKHIQQLVKDNLEDDSTLKEEVQRWSKKKGSDKKGE